MRTLTAGFPLTGFLRFADTIGSVVDGKRPQRVVVVAGPGCAELVDDLNVASLARGTLGGFCPTWEGECCRDTGARCGDCFPASERSDCAGGLDF